MANTILFRIFATNQVFKEILECFDWWKDESYQSWPSVILVAVEAQTFYYILCITLKRVSGAQLPISTLQCQ